jgi:hypothetical protein
MSGDYHFGDEVTQHGDHNIGMIKNQGPVDPKAALQEMISSVRALRGMLSEADREVIDESMETVGAGENAERQHLRRALGNIAGVATMVGQVGVPVIEAIQKVKEAFGI